MTRASTSTILTCDSVHLLRRNSRARSRGRGCCSAGMEEGFGGENLRGDRGLGGMGRSFLGLSGGGESFCWHVVRGEVGGLASSSEEADS